jgi:cytochrome b pre-mRNA-processing protein 3
MDDNFREMGVGDLKVPKEMRRIGEAFYGRAKTYDRALDDGDSPALTAALERNVFGGAQPLGARRLATYMQETAKRLATQDTAALAFPDPDAVTAQTQAEQTR